MGAEALVTRRSTVSIPEGSIKGAGQLAEVAALPHVSIPEGSIKGRVVESRLLFGHVFQSQKVRLKDVQKLVGLGIG